MSLAVTLSFRWEHTLRLARGRCSIDDADRGPARMKDIVQTPAYSYEKLHPGICSS